MWVKPCHRQEQKEEDIPDCLLGATITTGDGVITEDLRRQKEKLIKQTLRLQLDARRSPSARPDRSYDRHAGEGTISQVTQQTHMQLRFSSVLPAALWTSDKAVKFDSGIPRLPTWTPAGPVTSRSVQKKLLTRGGEQQLGVSYAGCMWGGTEG